MLRNFTLYQLPREKKNEANIKQYQLTSTCVYKIFLIIFCKTFQCSKQNMLNYYNLNIFLSYDPIYDLQFSQKWFAVFVALFVM
jgi:hypothetical protein